MKNSHIRLIIPLSDDMAVTQYGILGGKVDTLTSLPLSFNVAFATALVPAISAAKAVKDYKSIKQKSPITDPLPIFAPAFITQKFPIFTSLAI